MIKDETENSGKTLSEILINRYNVSKMNTDKNIMPFNQELKQASTDLKKYIAITKDNKDKEIDPKDVKYHQLPLWCIYDNGNSSMPTIFCCKIISHPSPEYGGPCIWGYSVYKREPGFRTLGINIDKFLATEYYHNAKFFVSMEDALKYIKKAITPKCN